MLKVKSKAADKMNSKPTFESETNIEKPKQKLEITQELIRNEISRRKKTVTFSTLIMKQPRVLLRDCRYDLDKINKTLPNETVKSVSSHIFLEHTYLQKRNSTSSHIRTKSFLKSGVEKTAGLKVSTGEKMSGSKVSAAENSIGSKVSTGGKISVEKKVSNAEENSAESRLPNGNKNSITSQTMSTVEKNSVSAKVSNGKSSAGNGLKRAGKWSEQTPKRRKIQDSHKERLPRLEVEVGAPNGFQLGYLPEKIVGVKENQHGVFYLVKWRNMSYLELVPQSITNKLIPHMVLGFLATRMFWRMESLSDSD